MGEQTISFLQTHITEARTSVRASSTSSPTIEIEARWKVLEEDHKKVLLFFTETQLHRERHRTTDSINGDLRETTLVSEGDDQKQVLRTRTRKTRKAQIVDKDLGCKIVVSVEEQFHGDFLHTKSTVSRFKDRWSFFDAGVRIDITEINCGQEYEIEVEIVHVAEKNILKRFMHALGSVNTHLSNETKPNALKRMMGNRFFGALPTTLQKQDLEILEKYEYAWSLKYDGLRRLILIDNDVKMKVYDRTLNLVTEHILNTPVRFPTIFDAELVDEQYILLDIVWMGKIDMRKSKLTLFERLQLCQQFINAQQIPNTSHKDLFMRKDYHRMDTINAFHQLHAHSPQSDGIIFTRVDVSYSPKSRDNLLFKWKSVQHQTIDFRAVKVQGRWSLHVCYPDKEREFHPYNYGACIELDENLTSCGVANAIIECYWNPDKNKMKILKFRKDKVRPNFYTTAQDIWNFISRPITFTQLEQLGT